VEDNVRAAELPPLADDAMAAVRETYDRSFRTAIHSHW
jgi:hypothetical protein